MGTSANTAEDHWEGRVHEGRFWSGIGRCTSADGDVFEGDWREGALWRGRVTLADGSAVCYDGSGEQKNMCL